MRVTLTGRHPAISAALVAVLAVVSVFVVVVVRTVTESNQIAKQGLESHANKQARKLCIKKTFSIYQVPPPPPRLLCWAMLLSDLELGGGAKARHIPGISLSMNSSIILSNCSKALS